MEVRTALAAIPGLTSPPVFAHGAWRTRVDVDALPRVVDRLLADLGGEVWLVAGEDRLAHDEMSAHYLLAVRNPAAADGRGARELFHLEVRLDRRQPHVPSLASLSFPASRFEREMRDLLGIVPAGHPDPRPLVRHGFWPDSFHPLREDAVLPAFSDDGQPFPFTAVEGEGIYEIPVGPVHAGVIEPGHFRFHVLGETILKMRARLYFTHKGTEKLFEGRLPEEGVELAERISGDTSVGHALAYCQALEAVAGVEVPDPARRWRTVLLEMERVYNHITDVGAIIADTGFAVGQAHCLRLREALLRLNKRVTGHRLLRGAIVPGGVAERASPAPDIVAELSRVAADFNEVVHLSVANTLVADRLDTTGHLSADVARDFGVVGYVARACGIAEDVRVNLPYAAYDRVPVDPVVEHTGDVQARLRVRAREVQASVGIVERALDRLAGSSLRTPLGRLEPHVAGFGIVEAWRGRLTHMVVADENGRLRRVKVVDPSFFNWPALARALEHNIVPDFPLCNKSFNQSYSGNDL